MIHEGIQSAVMLSWALSDASSPAVRLAAVDKDPGRLLNVSSALERLGLEARVMSGDATDPSTFWDGHLFDRVLLDAPCSGTGVIRRHPDIKVLRRPSDLSLIHI